MAIVLGDLSRDTERFRLALSEDVTVVDTLQALVATVEERPEEELVIVGADAPLTVATDVAERYRLERPALGVILLRRRVEVQAMTEAIRAGIREVVTADDVEALVQACTRSLAVSRQLRNQGSRAVESHRGRVVLVFGAKGGSGKTVVATNLAVAIASLDVGRVCLLDLNLGSGDVGIALQVEPIRTISDALGMQGGLDRDGLRSLVTPAGDRLDLLLAPRQPADAEFVTTQLVEEIIGVLAETYDFIVIDSPPVLDDMVLACLDRADSHVLVTTLDILALRNLKVTLDTLDALGYLRARRSVVLNRCDTRVGLTAQDIEQVIGQSIEVRLPSSRDVPSSLNRGVPLVRANPRHPFSRAIGDLAKREVRHRGDASTPVAGLPTGTRVPQMQGQGS